MSFNINFELISSFNNLTKKKQEKIKEIVKLFIHNNEQISNPELKSLVAHYIFNKIKTSTEYQPPFYTNKNKEYFEAMNKEELHMDNFISYIINTKTDHKPNDIKSVIFNGKECNLVNNKRPKIEDTKTTNDIGLIYKLIEERICSNGGLEPIINE